MVYDRARAEWKAPYGMADDRIHVAVFFDESFDDFTVQRHREEFAIGKAVTGRVECVQCGILSQQLLNIWPPSKRVALPTVDEQDLHFAATPAVSLELS